MAQVAFVWLECMRFTGSSGSGSSSQQQQRERKSEGWLGSIRVRASPSHIVHAPPDAPQAKSTEFKCTYIYTRIQMRLIRIRARADSRCDGAALTFYLSALMAFPFLQGSSFFFFLFFEKVERKNPLRLTQSRTPVTTTTQKEPSSLHRSRFVLASAIFRVVHDRASNALT